MGMKVSGRLTSIVSKSLSESFDLTGLQLIADDIFYNYNFHKQTGFPSNIEVPRQEAAKQLVADTKKTGLFVKLIQVMVDLHTMGHMGRKYPVKNLRFILSHMREAGMIYDQENRLFVENPSIQRTKNWGTLIEGEEYLLAFLRIDIVGNSKLVRKYPDDVIQTTYSDLRAIVEEAISRRNGRIWSWEGDGGLVAFFFSNKNLHATFAGMDIVNRIFTYNFFQCRLDGPLEVRVAVHSGTMPYVDSDEELGKSDIIRRVINIEANHTKPNTLTVSNTVANVFPQKMLQEFDKVKGERSHTYFNYNVKWEGPAIAAEEKGAQ